MPSSTTAPGSRLLPWPNRRHVLQAFTLPFAAWATVPVRAAAASDSGLWLSLFAGPVGAPPVYWLSRGTEFDVVDGVSTAVKSRVSVIAAIARPRDGHVRVSYLLQGINLSAAGFEKVPKLVHPITGDDIAVAASSPLSLGWNLTADGQLIEDLVAANGTKAIYRGRTWESPVSGAEHSATLQMNIQLIRPSGAVEALTEVSVFRARPVAMAVDGFRAATSETFTTRALPDQAGYAGARISSANLSHAESYRSTEDLRRAMRLVEVDALGAFFEQQSRWAQNT